MLHFTCDLCGQQLGDRRYVVRLEIFPAFDPEEIDEDDLDLIRRHAQMNYDNPRRLSRMTFEDKRGMLQRAFDGKTPEGKKLGIYITQKGDTLSYEIMGVLQQGIHGKLPMSLFEMQERLGIDTGDHPGAYDPFVPKKQKKKSKLKFMWINIILNTIKKLSNYALLMPFT